MEEKGRTNDGFGHFGICHRLFNFIMNSLLTRGTRRIAMGTNNEALLLEGGKDHNHVVSPGGQEILVEFRHTNGSMVNGTGNTSGQVLVNENPNSTKTGSRDQGNNWGREKSTKKSTLTSSQVLVKENVNSTQTHHKTGSHDQGDNNWDHEKSTKKSTLTSGHVMVKENEGREKSKKKSTLTSGQVSVKENANMTQTRKKTDSRDHGDDNGGREKASKKSTLTIVEGGNVYGRKHHLLDVTSNINEKADAFIRSRKEAMEKALSMKQTTDV